jgi:hypothetical protein
MDHQDEALAGIAHGRLYPGQALDRDSGVGFVVGRRLATARTKRCPPSGAGYARHRFRHSVHPDSPHEAVLPKPFEGRGEIISSAGGVSVWSSWQNAVEGHATYAGRPAGRCKIAGATGPNAAAGKSDAAAQRIGGPPVVPATQPRSVLKMP